EAQRDGEYIKFVEQVFDWKNILYLFYPYFWGRKCKWKELYNLIDVDPVFQQFKQAGSARVMVAVRPGFELAAINFLTLGYPDMNDLTTMPILDIIDELDAGDPDWEEVINPSLLLPTTLTILECKSAGIDVDSPAIEGMCEEDSSLGNGTQNSTGSSNQSIQQ
ncbi:MAG: hypothetical protein KDE33_20260, partial [Bacteroidetes bacterium]|nr:hypothetical protein [Bacteroidota bacterium]